MRSLKSLFGPFHYYAEILTSISADRLGNILRDILLRYMNSDNAMDPLNQGCSRPHLIVVNRCGAPREHPQHTANQGPAVGASEIEDEVVETSDNEELAFDLALQRPSYWLAPSLYPPFLQTTDPKPLCLSQRAVGASSVQLSTVRSISYASRFIRYMPRLSI